LKDALQIYQEDQNKILADKHDLTQQVLRLKDRDARLSEQERLNKTLADEN